MSDAGTVLVSHQGAAWLPDGGRADVVLAGRRATPPDPTCLVRLLATRDGRVLAVARADGRGLDIPTVHAGDGGTERSLAELLVRALGGVRPATLLGYVRNVVPEAPDDYPWPSPDAYFCVWRCEVAADTVPEGVWLDPAEAEAQMRDRHWWPLACHALG